MTDLRKFKSLVIFSAVLAALVVSYNVLQDYLLPFSGYIERRLYYEKVISKKGLGLHKGTYWKEKE